MQKALALQLDALDSIVNFYAASESVSRDGFQTFADGLLKTRSAIQALEWIPRVAAEAREGYEARARKDGLTDFAFTERGAAGHMNPAGPRDTYFPVFYVVPYARNKKALGFDLGSNPARLSALYHARDSGRIVVSGRIRLVQENGDQFGFLAFLPIYREGEPHDTPRRREENLDSFALGVFRFGDLVEAALESQSASRAGLDTYLFDHEVAPQARLLNFGVVLIRTLGC